MLVASRPRSPSFCRSWIPYATGMMSRIASRPNLEMNSRTTSLRGRDGRAGMDADSMGGCRRPALAAGGTSLPAAETPCRLLGGLRLDHLVEHQLAALGLVSAVVAQRGVAVLVDVVGPQRALAALRGEERVDHGLPIVAALGDRVAHDRHRLVAVYGVRVDLVLGLTVLGLVVLVELLAGGRELVGRERRSRQERLRLDLLRDLLREVHGRDAVGSEQLGVRQRGVEVLVQLRRVVVDDAAREDGVRAAGLDLGRQRTVVGRLAVPGVVARDLDPELLRGGLRVLRDALAVHLGVVEDVDALDALVLHVLRLRGALDRVDRDDAPVVALAGRVVLVRLAGLGACAALGQAERRVRRADLQDPGLVVDRDRDRRGAGVELAEIGDRVVVLGDLARVGRRLAGLPLARGRRRIVERHVLDRPVAALVALLLERELLAVDHVLGLRTRRALQRQGRVDGQRLVAAALGRRPAAVVVVATARGDAEGHYGR